MNLKQALAATRVSALSYNRENKLLTLSEKINYQHIQ